jgi:hypothetical protein
MLNDLIRNLTPKNQWDLQGSRLKKKRTLNKEVSKYVHKQKKPKGMTPLGRKPTGNRPLQRLRCRWKDGIKMDLRETGWEDADWIHLVQHRDQWRALVKMVMNLQILVPRS